MPDDEFKKGAPIVCATKVTFLMLLSGCGSEKTWKTTPTSSYTKYQAPTSIRRSSLCYFILLISIFGRLRDFGWESEGNGVRVVCSVLTDLGNW